MAEPRKIAPHPWWMVWLWYPGARLLAWTLMAILGPLRVRGKYRIPRTGGVLILSNHLSDIDPIVVQMACPRPIHFMAKQSLFEIPVLAPLIRMCRAFPIKPGGADRASLKQAIELLKMGEVVCVFPEGELSPDGQLQPIRPGIALIARSAGVPTICVGLRRTDRVIPYGQVVPRPSFTTTEATWGEPRSSAGDEYLARVEAELRSLI